jgi:hypothetical protein
MGGEGEGADGPIQKTKKSVTRAETPIERIYGEETGRNMPRSLKRIMIPKGTVKRQPR